MAEAKRLVIFGDSIAKGVMFQDGRYHLCRAHDFDALAQQGVEVLNFAKMGACTDTGLAIAKKQLELCQGAQVLLSFGGNDCDFDWSAVSERPQAHHEPHTPLKQFEALYTKAIQLIQEKKGNPMLLTLPPLEPKRYFQWISRNLHPDNILHWLGGVDTIYRWQEMYNMKVLLLAQKLHVPVVDIRSAFLAQHGYQALLCEDGIHPNRKGHRFIYKTIMQQYHPCLQD